MSQVRSANSRARRRSEHGATLVEAAIALPLLLLLIFGVMEFGLLFKDWLTVGHAAREGARAGATMGDDRFANIAILDVVEDRMGTVSSADAGMKVRVYNPLGAGTDLYTYMPGSTFCVTPGDCCVWSPCPDPRYVPPTFPIYHYTVPSWAPSGRDVSAPSTDRIGVEVFYGHAFITGLIWQTDLDVTESVDYQIEPQIFE